MQITDRMQSATLAAIKHLTNDINDKEKQLETLEKELFILREKAMITVSSAKGIGNLGEAKQRKTREILPNSFALNNVELIDSVKCLGGELIDKKLKLSRLKKKALEEVAEDSAKKYEELAHQLSEEHAFIYAVGRHTKQINHMLWSEIFIPSGVKYSGLQERSETPNGRFCFYHKAKSGKMADEIARSISRFFT